MRRIHIPNRPPVCKSYQTGDATVKANGLSVRRQHQSPTKPLSGVSFRPPWISVGGKPLENRRRPGKHTGPSGFLGRRTLPRHCCRASRRVGSGQHRAGWFPSRRGNVAPSRHQQRCRRRHPQATVAHLQDRRRSNPATGRVAVYYCSSRRGIGRHALHCEP